MKTRTPDAPMMLTLLLAALALILPNLAVAQTTSFSETGELKAEPFENGGRMQEPGAKRPGPYASLDLGGAVFHLDDDVLDRLRTLDIDLADQASGGGLSLGWSWSNELALEMQLFGGTVSTGRPDLDATLAQANLALRAPLLTRGRIAPYLEGSLGATALVFEGSAVEDRTFVGANTGLGGGIEVHLSPRWALDFGYAVSLVDFETEVLTAQDDEEIDLEGTGRVHRWTVRTVFSF